LGEKTPVTASTTGTFIGLKMSDDYGFSEVVQLGVNTPLTQFARSFTKVPGKNTLLLKLLPQEAEAIRQSHGLTPIVVSLLDGAGNTGSATANFKFDDGLALYSLNSTRELCVYPNSDYVTKVNGTNEYDYRVIGHWDESIGTELYMNGKHVELDGEGYFDFKARLNPYPNLTTFTFSTFNSKDEQVTVGAGNVKIYDQPFGVKLDVTGVNIPNISEGYVKGIYTKRLEGFQRARQLSLIGETIGGNGLSVDNMSTGGNYNVGTNDNKATFHVPLVSGDNFIVATTKKNDPSFGEMVAYAGILARQVDAETVFFKSLHPTKLNVIDETDSVYNSENETLSVDGELLNFDAFLFDNFHIYGYPGGDENPKNKVKIENDGSFHYDFPLALGQKRSLQYKIQKDDDEYETNELVVQAKPKAQAVLNLDNAEYNNEKDVFEVFTNADTFTLKGKLLTSSKAAVINLNGNNIFTLDKEGDLNAEMGDVHEFSTTVDLNKGAEGTETSTMLNIQFATSEVREFQTSKLLVHRLKKKLIKPTVHADTTLPTLNQVHLNAASTDENEQIQWSTDNQTFVDYTDPIQIVKNQKVYFKTIDAYGNESETSIYDVKNIVEGLIANAKKVATYKGNSLVFVSLNQPLTREVLKYFKIESSTDGGGHWKKCNQLDLTVVPAHTTLSLRVVDTLGKTSQITTWKNQ
jgi:hypothetical protein